MFSFAGGGSNRFKRNQEGEFAARSRITFDPDFAAHPLHQAASNGQAQSHTVLALSTRQSKEIVENFQMEFSRDAGAGIGNTDLHRIRMRDALAATFGSRGK